MPPCVPWKLAVHRREDKRRCGIGRDQVEVFFITDDIFGRIRVVARTFGLATMIMIGNCKFEFYKPYCLVSEDGAIRWWFAS